jgi:hypothetical protein
MIPLKYVGRQLPNSIRFWTEKALNGYEQFVWINFPHTVIRESVSYTKNFRSFMANLCSSITITILDIIHHPVFYLKLNSTLYACRYLTGNTLRLRYESNRLMLSIGLWRWYINITITILDIIPRSVLYLKQAFWILNSVPVFRWRLSWAQQIELVCLLETGPNWVRSTWRWRQNAVSETLCLKRRTGRWIMSRIVIVILIYHRHKPIDSIKLFGS